MLWRIIGNRWGALIVGAVALVIGLVLMQSSEVKCGSQMMSPGDICQVTKRGNTTERTYDEQKSSGKTTAYIITGVGALLIIGGGVAFVLRMRRRSADPAPAPAPTAPSA